MGNLVDLYQKKVLNRGLEEIYNCLNKIDRENLPLNIYDSTIIDLLNEVREIVYYINDELLRDVEDIYCINIIMEMLEDINTMESLLDIRLRDIHEVQQEYQEYLDTDSYSQIENDRLTDTIFNFQDEICNLRNNYIELIEYLEEQI